MSHRATPQQLATQYLAHKQKIKEVNEEKKRAQEQLMAQLGVNQTLTVGDVTLEVEEKDSGPPSLTAKRMYDLLTEYLNSPEFEEELRAEQGQPRSANGFKKHVRAQQRAAKGRGGKKRRLKQSKA